MSETSSHDTDTTSGGVTLTGSDAPAGVADALSTLDDGAEAGTRSVESRAMAVPIPQPLVANQVTLGVNYYQWTFNWFRAFVPTDSRSPIIFGTLAETRGTGHATLFCGARSVNGRDGVLITVFVIGQPSFNPPSVVVTLMQAGAKQYDAPVPYTGG